MSMPGGIEDGFVDVGDAPARQDIPIAPDAEAFLTALAATMHGGSPDTAALDAFGVRWGTEFPDLPVGAHELPAG